MNISSLSLQIDSPLTNPNAANYRPLEWPPGPDWSPVLNAQGEPQCYYADDYWPLDAWCGTPLRINFGDGETRGSRIDRDNANILRQCTAWFLWGTRGCRSAATLFFKFTQIKPLFVTCSHEGIVATDLMRYDAVIDKVANALSPAHYEKAIAIFHELLNDRDKLQFCLLDATGLARLSRLAPNHQKKQTPYIPPRIWGYQVSRLHEFLDSYARNKEKIADCFDFCINAYSHNYGSLKLAMAKRRGCERSPFHNHRPWSGVIFHGCFEKTADKFGIKDLIEKWADPFTHEKGEKQLARFSKYLDLVSMAGLAYVLNFSLMRVEEGWNLRSDCLLHELDDELGHTYLLRGETTKTDPDSDARWPVSNSCRLAIEVMQHVASLRMRCAKEADNIDLNAEDIANPYIISYQYEPWSKGRHKSYKIRPAIKHYRQALGGITGILEASQITITDSDLKTARLITPTLDTEIFKVGLPWSFAWHQLRRTGAVNMLSSDLVEESSLQWLLKHQSRAMTLYYGRNHHRLALNEETRQLFLKTMYQEIGRDLQKLCSPDFISPLGPSRKATVVNFISETDARSLDKAARKGEVGARRIRAGFCVNSRPCPYGGVEAIAHCLGGDDEKGCPDLLIDLKKLSGIQLYECVIEEQLKVVHVESPRYQSLQAEKRAIKKFCEISQS